ncbi:MAG: hypothetical protein WC548_01810 [Candidatus Pacearchaeota archaeon]
MEIEFNGLYFEASKKPRRHYACDEYAEMQRLGWGFRDGKVERKIKLQPNSHCGKYEVREYSLQQVAATLSGPLVFGNKAQTDAICAARIFQIIFKSEGWQHSSIPELKERVRDEIQLAEDTNSQWTLK